MFLSLMNHVYVIFLLFQFSAVRHLKFKISQTQKFGAKTSIDIMILTPAQELSRRLAKSLNSQIKSN